jgi:hypothetical protein
MSNQLLSPAGLDPALQKALAETLRLWWETLHDLQRRAGQAQPPPSPLRRLLALAAFEASSRAIQSAEQLLREGRTLDRKEWKNLCAYLEHTSLAYLATLPARLPDSIEVQRLILSWAISLATAWQTANPASGRPAQPASLLPASPWVTWETEPEKPLQ